MKLIVGYIYNLGLFHCKISIIFYVRIIGSPLKKTQYQRKFFFRSSSNFLLYYNLFDMKVLKTIWMKTNITLFTKVLARF